MVRFHYQPTFEDWFALHRIILFRQFRSLSVIAAFIFGCYLSYPFALTYLGHDEGTVLEVYWKNAGILILPGMVGLLLVSTYVAVRKRWKSAEELREARDYEIDEKGVRVTGPTLAGYMEWRHFTKAERKRGYYLLKTAQNQFHYFPESAVPDPRALDELLAAKIGGKKRT